MRYAVVLPDADAMRSRRFNLELILDNLASNGIEHFLVDDRWPSSPVLGVPEEARPHLAGVLARSTEVPIYLKVATGGGSTRTSFQSTTAGEGEDLGNAFWVFAYLVNPKSTGRFGHADGCLIEFWDDVGGALQPQTADRKSAVDRIAPASRRRHTSANVLGRAVPVYEPLPIRGMMDVDFPIDVVYTWVNGDDPAWQESRVARMGEVGGEVPDDATHPGRFRQFDELRYSLRSLERNAPWVRNIFLVTDGQRPEWLNEGGTNLTVVDHREFMPSTALPTFNSHAIEASLHRIPGLADQFLLMNDDVFFGSPLGPGTLFQSNGVGKFFLSRTRISQSPRASHEFARLHSADLIEGATGMRPEYLLKHTPMALVRSFLEQLEQEFQDAWFRTVHAPFRSKSDIVPTYMHHYIGYGRRLTRPAPVNYSYFKFGSAEGETAMELYRKSAPSVFFCVNDETYPEDAVRSGRRFLADFLASQFPRASRYERPAAC